VARGAALDEMALMADLAKRGGARPRCHLSHPSSSARRATRRGLGWRFTSAL